MSVNMNVAELLTLQAVRSQAHKVLAAAREGELTNFDYHEDLMPKAVEYVANTIIKDYGPDRYDQIPPHGRLGHFNSGNRDRLSPVIEEWRRSADKVEVTRRIVDLLFFSVLIDAGAGDTWKFTEPETGDVYSRSEGIAVASWHMFLSGKLQTAGKIRHSVDARGLQDIDESTMSVYFQNTPDNTMTGFTSRVLLLNNLGASLKALPDIFGQDGRPGNLVDYLLNSSKDTDILDFEDLWRVLQALLLPIWPKERTHVDGHPVGDAWPLKVLARTTKPSCHTDVAHTIQPFHKLTQWLGFSLRVPFTKFLGVRWMNEGLSTGLAEYRHGGVFVDLGILQLKPDVLREGQKNSGQEIPSFNVKSDPIVEWRAMTVALLDEVHDALAPRFAREYCVSLTLAQMLEAGSFKAGRELAALYRPKTRSGPILISGDGTLL